MISLHPNAIDLSGMVFERLTVIGLSSKRKHGALAWECQCVCGKFVEVVSHHLRNKRTKSCGCLKGEMSGNRVRTHGGRSEALYEVWAGMKARCSNPNHGSFKNYGGRGIKVCERWASSYEDFAADVSPRPKGLTLERINNNGNYEPDNVKWATRKEQNRNSRVVTLLECGGVILPLVEWAELSGNSASAIAARLRNGYSTASAIFASNFTVMRLGHRKAS